MFYLILVIFTIVVLGEAADWVQVWSDEFDGTDLNDGEWNYETGGNGWGNSELEYYTSHRRENVRLEDGHLVINAVVEDYDQNHFTSGRLTTKKAWTYGKFEARAKLPKGKQLWPAFWMMPKDSVYGGWAASGEIDIMEYRGDKDNEVEGTIHYGGSWPNNIYSGSGPKNLGINFSDDYHIFAVEWDNNEIRWYVDGSQYHSENINRNMWSGKGNNPYTQNGQPFDKDFFIILNVAVGGGFFPADQFGQPVTPDEARQWPRPVMDVDYVRVYQRQ